jgi:hypothetical protein
MSQDWPQLPAADGAHACVGLGVGAPSAPLQASSGPGDKPLQWHALMRVVQCLCERCRLHCTWQYMAQAMSLPRWLLQDRGAVQQAGHRVVL